LIYTVDGSLPAGVMVNIDDNTHEMTVTAGSPGDVLTVHVSVFATAGELVFTQDTIQIAP